jgi:hypothetical protein
MELEQQINKPNPAEAAVKKEESKPITDEEIVEANWLFKSGKDSARLAELKAWREKERDIIFRQFDHEIIFGVKPGDSNKEYQAAERHYESIIEMKGNGTLDDFALKVERLQNWEKSPDEVKNGFSEIKRNKKVEFNKLIIDVKSARNARFVKKDDWNNFLERAKGGEKISKPEMDFFKKAIIIQDLELKNDIPNYRGEAAIYLPDLAEGWKKELNNTYTQSLKNLRVRVNDRKGRIEQFEAVKNRRRL